jgi:uncharacterized phage protein (TIGR02218 family)
MPRVIPIQIADHIAGGSTTLCRLLKITPVQPGYAPFGLTSLDRDVRYDDGNGLLVYSAPIGTELSTLIAASDMTVAGGETKQLMPVYDTPTAEADIRAGAYDYAEFVLYEVNYNDLTSGRHIVIQTGTTGRNTVTDSGLSWITELRGLTQVLKQSITEKWSLSCRAVFGSMVPTPQSRYPCLFDVTPLWHTDTVTAVGVDTTQEFHAGAFTPTYGGAPGMVEWLTGDNAGRTDETESFNTESGPGSVPVIIGLTFGASYPIKVGDTFRFRDDCPKTPTACHARNNYPHYRGEPSIPVSDNGALSVGLIGTAVTTTTGDD